MQSQSQQVQKFRYKTDLDKETLTQNFEKRGWQKCQQNEQWNVYWALPESVRRIFHPDSGMRMNETQILNHFPNHGELTRKDLMVKNIKRFRKDMEKENNPVAERDEMGNLIYLDIVPMTYIFPGDYTIFVEEFKKNPNTTWIMKPTAGAQGLGIFLVTKLKQIQDHSKKPYVISRYIEKPLLVGKKKFDLRIYVLVTSYKPLKVWLSSLGFARFCTENYSSDIGEMDNMMIHLTNNAIQKKQNDFNTKHGSKWSIENLRFYLEQTRGKAATNKCFDDIKNIIYISLKSVQNVIINDKHCFEMYGYDILIEDNLKPWLIEVNASPSLSSTTEADRKLKMSVMESVFQIVVPPSWFDENSKHGTNQSKELQVGSFSLIIDEAQNNGQDNSKDYRGKAGLGKQTKGMGTLWK